MDETKEKIEEMVASMSFARKKPATKKTKQEFADTYSTLGDIKAKVDNLHLALWHAKEKKDYHSTSLDDAKKELRQIKDEIGIII